MTLDLTGIATSVIAGVFSVAAILIPMWLAAHMKNKQDAAVLAAAVKNSLGAIEQAATGEVVLLHPAIAIPSVPPNVAIGAQYVLDHAGAEAARLGITPLAIAAKVSAQIGLTMITARSAPLPPVTKAPIPAVPTALLPNVPLVPRAA